LDKEELSANIFEYIQTNYFIKSLVGGVKSRCFRLFFDTERFEDDLKEKI